MASEDKRIQQFPRKEICTLSCPHCFREELILQNFSLTFPNATYRIYHLSLDLSDHIHASCLCSLTASIYQNMRCSIFPILFRLHANGKPVPSGHLQLSPLHGRDGCHSHVPPPGAARQLHGDIWSTYSTGYGTKLKSSAYQRALWCCSLRVRDVSQNRSPYFFAEPAQWVEEARHLVVTLISQPLWSKGFGH